MSAEPATSTTPPTQREDRTPRAVSRYLLPGLLGLVVLLLIVVSASLMIGAKAIPYGEVLDSLWNFDPGNPDHLIVRDLRVSRTLIGLLVGIALGLAGVLMQGVTRNPLADPGLFGVEAGAALGVVVAAYLFDVSSLSTSVWFGLVGAGVASVAVFAIGSVGNVRTTPVRLALAGAAMAAALAAITTAILFLDRLAFQETRFWLVGSLQGRDMEVVRQVAPFIIVGTVLALTLSRALDLLALGQDLARALGQRVVLTQAVIVLSITLMTAGAVAAAGPIAFIGFFVPHIARAMTGPASRWTLAYTAILAPLILLTADVIGRFVVRPAELEVGIVTALIGGPLFIALVRRKRLAQL